jgi:23S rRNA-/tRNA-specific pseudouridylate synthase
MSVVPKSQGREAITEYLVVAQREDANGLPVSFLKLWPKTGRKHQLRVHCADCLRAPIIGDRRYGYIPRGEPVSKFKYM